MHWMDEENGLRVPVLDAAAQAGSLGGRSFVKGNVMIVVTGVTGNTGNVTADRLLARGEKVRVVVRDAKKGASFAARGAQVAVADLGDRAALAAALRGADSAYLLLPPNLAAASFRGYQRDTVKAMAAAVADAKLPHAVLLSSVGAELEGGTGPIVGLHEAEEELGRVPGLSLASLRAAYFMENFGASLGALAQDVLPSFLPASFPIAMVATKDIGELAATLLVERAKGVTNLGSPFSMNDAAAALSTLTGRTIQVAEAPLAAMADTLAGYGMPKEIAALYQEMTQGMAEGRIRFDTAHRTLAGRTGLLEVLRGLMPQAS